VVSRFFSQERERERVSDNQKKDEKDEEHRALIKKRDLYRKRVALRFSQTLSSFPFLSVSNPKFFYHLSTHISHALL